jgi:hypothetical protein
MKKLLATLGVIAVAALVCVPGAHAADGPDITITVLDLPDEPLVLAVGESRTFQIEITSTEEFIFAAAMPDAYYPGRGVIFRGRDQVTKDTTARLELTVTGKGSTAGFEPVCGWYAETSECSPAGLAPLAIVAGVRFPGGIAVGEAFPFWVIVTE